MISLFCGLVATMVAYSQSLSSVNGTITDSYTTKPITGVLVTILGTTIQKQTDHNGNFNLKNVPIGEQILQLKYERYASQKIPISVFEGQTLNLGGIVLYEAVVEQNDLSVISLSDDELNDDEGGADNTTGMLQSSKDIFLSTAAYEFSATFFRPRGYSSEHGKLLINGIEMNKMYNGRPQWTNIKKDIWLIYSSLIPFQL